MCTVRDCGQASGEMYMCKDCAELLKRDLRSLAGMRGRSLFAELQVAAVRQNQFGTPLGVLTVKGAQTPLPYNEKASDQSAGMRDVLAFWLDEISVMADGEQAMPTERLGGPKLAKLLLGNVNVIRRHPRAMDIFENVNGGVKRILQAIDLPEGRVYAGSCDGARAEPGEFAQEPCGFDLFARPRTTEVQCQICLRKYDVASRRRDMIDSLEDHIGSCDYVARICTGLGVKVGESSIRRWAKQSRLHVAHWERKPGGGMRPLYRVGDVVSLAAGNMPRATYSTSTRQDGGERDNGADL